MKIAAYILAADPAWIEASIGSYYHMVERFVVSYDENGLGYTGARLDVEQSLKRLRKIDPEGKFDYRPGHYARPEFFDHPMDNDTYQRQCALGQASEGADWVLQIDTDEIIGDPATFADCLEEAHRTGSLALNYPSHWLYSRVGQGWALELGKRGWRSEPGFPGPMAVRAGSTLTMARRIERGHFHVDLTQRGSSGRVPNGIDVDRVIPSSAAIYHLCMWRDEAWLRRKFAASSHARDRDWNPEIQRWLWAQKHPLLKVVTSQFGRGINKRPLRLLRLPLSVQAAIATSGVSEQTAPETSS